ncbi:MAG TPA: NUDIX domain-containing protein, partial [Nakamurella sp.]
MVRSASPGSAADPRSEIPLRRAATVMLLRDTAAGLEVFVLRRVTGMAFAAGMTVFPGGAVDTADDAAPLAWVGPDAIWWAERLGVSARDAASLVVAAVRELFEETGVLLAGP